MHIRSALFVDFDNIHSRLYKQDAGLAGHFGEEPGRWLAWLAERLPFDSDNSDTISRKILIRRCYLNPKAFQHYRPYLIRSALQVVECPPLTRQGKTSTDIRMVMDILDVLNHDVHYEEFIILSADADFTHVLLRLREYDRRTALLAIGPSALAYREACDLLIDQDKFLTAVMGVPEIRVDVLVKDAPAARETLARISSLVSKFVRESTKPVVMARVAQHISEHSGDEILKSDWLGAGSFKSFLAQLDMPDLVISPQVIPGYIYDPKIHIPPEVSEPVDEFMETSMDIAILARKVHQLTDTPYLMPEHYSALFDEIAIEINLHGYFLTRTSKNVRDRCIERGLPVARSHVNFVLRGLEYAGHNLHQTPQDAKDIAESILKNTLNLCEIVQLELSEQDERNLRKWML